LGELPRSCASSVPECSSKVKWDSTMPTDVRPLSFTLSHNHEPRGNRTGGSVYTLHSVTRQPRVCKRDTWHSSFPTSLAKPPCGQIGVGFGKGSTFMLSHVGWSTRAGPSIPQAHASVGLGFAGVVTSGRTSFARYHFEILKRQHNRF
jgi:hypothetical protein